MRYMASRHTKCNNQRLTSIAIALVGTQPSASRCQSHNLARIAMWQNPPKIGRREAALLTISLSSNTFREGRSREKLGSGKLKDSAHAYSMRGDSAKGIYWMEKGRRHWSCSENRVYRAGKGSFSVFDNNQTLFTQTNLPTALS